MLVLKTKKVSFDVDTKTSQICVSSISILHGIEWTMCKFISPCIWLQNRLIFDVNRHKNLRVCSRKMIRHWLKLIKIRKMWHELLCMIDLLRACSQQYRQEPASSSSGSNHTFYFPTFSFFFFGNCECVRLCGSHSTTTNWMQMEWKNELCRLKIGRVVYADAHSTMKPNYSINRWKPLFQWMPQMIWRPILLLILNMYHVCTMDINLNK